MSAAVSLSSVTATSLSAHSDSSGSSGSGGGSSGGGGGSSGSQGREQSLLCARPTPVATEGSVVVSRAGTTTTTGPTSRSAIRRYPGSVSAQQLTVLPGPLGENGWRIMGYIFGLTNETSYGPVKYDEKTLLEVAVHRFTGDSRTLTGPHIDALVWQLLYEWKFIHHGFSASRCLALLVLNNLATPIQINDVKVKEGRNSRVYGQRGYDSAARCVLPGGFVLIFAWGFMPSLVDLAHVKVVVSTSVCAVTVSTRKNRSQCDSVEQGFSVGFLEKSLKDWWAKYVLVVSEAVS